MGKALEVKIQGQKEMAKAFKKSPEIVLGEINPAIRKTLLKIEARAIPKIPTDTGFLRNANVTIFSNLKGVLENRAPYAIFVHEGTKRHFPPRHGIERWARRHNIATFLVQRAIARRGTKAIPFYSDAIRETSGEAEIIFRKALNNITIKLAK